MEDIIRERDRLAGELAALQALINNPQTDQFLRATKNELIHQVQRWGTVSDRAKEPQDWFWLVGYLAGKALHHHKAAESQGQEVDRQKAAGIECGALVAALNREKALHHTISTAAALGNWFLAIKLGPQDMAPGASDLVESLEAVFGDLDEMPSNNSKEQPK